MVDTPKLDDPYASPQDVRVTPSRPPHPVSVHSAFRIIIQAIAGFAIAGGAVGLLLGIIAPSYYRTVFEQLTNDPSFVPWQVGLGLGITQGAVCGAICGVVVVLSVAWSNSRHASPRG